jgi:hypothetical protein
MTPEAPMSSSADAGSYGSTSDALDSVLDAPSTQQSAPELPQQQTPEPEAEYQAEDATEQGEAEAASDESIVDEDGHDEQFTDEAGRKYYNVKPDRMRGFVSAKNFVKSIEEFAPTVADAKAHYEGASDFRAMQSMFDSAEPESMNQFMNYWHKGSPEAFGSMAQRLPAFLASQAGSNPMAAQALNQIEAQVHRVTINRAYDKAQQTGDKDDFLSAQALDYAINGRYIETMDRIPSRQRQVDPQDQMRQREQQIDQREAQFANQRWQEFDKSYISGAKDAAINSAVDAAFKVAESAYPAGILKATKREAIVQIQESIEKNSFEFSRNQKVETSDIQRDLVRAIRSGQATNLEPRAARLVEEFKARVNRILPSIVKPLIGDATKGVMQQSQATHNRLATGSQKTAPGAGGKPAPRDIFPKPNWKTASEGLDALLG